MERVFCVDMFRNYCKSFGCYTKAKKYAEDVADTNNRPVSIFEIDGLTLVSETVVIPRR